MPTDEERREVAAGLRRLAEKHDGVTWFLVEKHTGLAPDERYMGSSVYTSESVARLADLIEPEPERTCHPVHPERFDQDGRLHMLFHRCSLCGRDLPYEAEKGHCGYCPNCGARVVVE